MKNYFSVNCMVERNKSNLNLNFHLIKPHHLQQMKEIWNQYYDILRSSKRKHTLESLTEWFKNRYNDNHEYYGLSIAGILVGFVIIREPNTSTNILWIKMFAIDKKFQSRGYGTFVVNTLKSKFPHRQIKLECFIRNFHALNFFINHGFKIIEYKKKHREYILKLEKKPKKEC